MQDQHPQLDQVAQEPKPPTLPKFVTVTTYKGKGNRQRKKTQRVTVPVRVRDEEKISRATAAATDEYARKSYARLALQLEAVPPGVPAMVRYWYAGVDVFASGPIARGGQVVSIERRAKIWADGLRGRR